jgi:uncharacterized membrane protein YtjA (UPF0391 family)
MSLLQKSLGKDSISNILFVIFCLILVISFLFGCQEDVGKD